MSIWTCSWSLISLCVIVARKCISYWVLNFFVSYIRVVVDREWRTCATVLDRVCASLCVRILLTAANVGSDSRSIPFGPEKKKARLWMIVIYSWLCDEIDEGYIVDYMHIDTFWHLNGFGTSLSNRINVIFFPTFWAVSYIISNSGPMTS